jgi:poly [ADP-ribose] polymerase
LRSVVFIGGYENFLSLIPFFLLPWNQIDLKKMPLGKLSKKQIQDAYKILTELTKLIDQKGTPTQFLDASNRFYTLIPHDFGMRKPPMLDTSEIVKVDALFIFNSVLSTFK